MDTIYYHAKTTGFYASVAALHREYKKINPSATKRYVQDFLKGSEVYARYKTHPLKFSRRIFIACIPGAI